MEQQNRFLFRPEFRWPKDKESAPFFTVPAWWRRFIFYTLRPRDLTVYHYYLSIMNQFGIAFPTVEQIASDLGIADRDAIRKSIGKLVDCGFLLKPDSAEKKAFGIGKRYVFQRPCVQYTIWKLLKEGEIDGELFPINPANARSRNEDDAPHLKSSDSVVHAGIKTMLGNEMYPAYEEAVRAQDVRRSERLTKGLLAMLEDQLKERRKHIAIKRPPRLYLANSLEGLPESVKDAFILEDAAKSATAQKRGRRALGEYAADKEEAAPHEEADSSPSDTLD